MKPPPPCAGCGRERDQLRGPGVGVLTITPLGLPVEPEVKITCDRFYHGSTGSYRAVVLAVVCADGDREAIEVHGCGDPGRRVYALAEPALAGVGGAFDPDTTTVR